MKTESQPLIPARMLNEWTYCPRLAILEWVHGEFADNAYTLDGARKHRRVDRPSRSPPEEAAADEGPWRATSVWLESPGEGLAARMDVVEGANGEAWPVDTKRGRIPEVPEGAYEPERVQLCAQGLILGAGGRRCGRGYLYFADSRRRVEVVFDEALVERTRELARGLRACAEGGELPPPLAGSPKCVGCSLVGICLPDETALLARGEEGGVEPLRQLLASRVYATPLYVTDSRARVGVTKGRFRVKREAEVLAESRVRDTSQIAIFGRAQVSTQALRAAMDAGLPVCYFTFGGYFVGLARGHTHKNVVLRQAQYAVAGDDEASLAVARQIVRGKVRNQRTLLRRNHRGAGKVALRELRRLADAALDASDAGVLLGLEGAAAALYFRAFDGMLKTTGMAFDLHARNRRPPRDPVNALLSFVYSVLCKDCSAAALAVGLDPYLGFYHRPRYGKPALALDLMEELRPLIADSVVVSVINNGEVRESSFVMRGDGCNLTRAGRTAVLRAYERRLAQEIHHPLFGYRASWRRVIDIQARLLGRHLLGETPCYRPIETR